MVSSAAKGQHEAGRAGAQGEAVAEKEKVISGDHIYLHILELNLILTFLLPAVSDVRLPGYMHTSLAPLTTSVSYSTISSKRRFVDLP